MPEKIPQNYQELSKRLDEVSLKLQDPDVSVDNATKYYEQAMDLIARLEGLLESAENTVSEIKAKYSVG